MHQIESFKSCTFLNLHSLTCQLFRVQLVEMKMKPGVWLKESDDEPNFLFRTFNFKRKTAWCTTPVQISPLERPQGSVCSGGPGGFWEKVCV